MDPQYWQQFGQWQEAEEDEIDRANAEAAEARDEEYLAELESKFPAMKGWR
jgi:hypothetical protein